MVIAGMLGIPIAEWRRFRRWSDVIVTSGSLAIPGGAQWTAAAEDMALVTAEMKDSLREWVGERRAAPKDDLLTALIQAEVDGDRLSEEELFGFFQLLLIAGAETAANLIGNAILCFTEHPGQLARVRQTPEPPPPAIEEVLRYRSPLQWMLRFTAREIELGGQSIPAGKRILVMIGSANRDPKHFADQPLRYRSHPESAHGIRPRHPLLYRGPALAIGEPSGAFSLSRPDRVLRAFRRADAGGM